MATSEIIKDDAAYVRYLRRRLEQADAANALLNAEIRELRKELADLRATIRDYQMQPQPPRSSD